MHVRGVKFGPQFFKKKSEQHQPLVCSSFSIGWSLIDKRWCLIITILELSNHCDGGDHNHDVDGDNVEDLEVPNH